MLLILPMLALSSCDKGVNGKFVANIIPEESSEKYFNNTELQELTEQWLTELNAEIGSGKHTDRESVALFGVYCSTIRVSAESKDIHVEDNTYITLDLTSLDSGVLLQRKQIFFTAK